MKVKFKTISDEMLDEGLPSHQALTPNNVYQVIGLSVNDVRIMDDQGEPSLYPLSWFSIVDERWPNDWITTIGTDGERYVSPRILSENYFWERYFDGETGAIQTFREHLRERVYAEE